MRHNLLLDYEFAVAQQGFIVRALIKLEGHAPVGATRTPLNLSIVLDRSGSMSGGKLEAARDAAAFLVRRLSPDDVVSVVAYDEQVETVALPATGAEQADLERRIEGIESGGSTNLSGGWLRGRELVAERVREGRMSRVILLTDGQANVGIKEPPRLAELCSTAKRAGITTTTIGFGADYDERLLRGMADAGGGNTFYIERPDQAPGVFEEEIEGLLSLSAQNVAVELVPSAAVRLIAIHNSYPMHELPSGGRRIELGDLYAREPKSLLLEFFAPALADLFPREIATLTVRAQVLTDGGGVEQQEVRFPIATPLDAEGHAEPEVRREMLLQEAARAREAALERRDRGDLGGAQQALRQAAMHLSAAADSPELLEQSVDLLAMADQMESAVFDAADAKYLAQRAYNAQRGKGLYEQKLSRTKRGGSP